MARFRLLWLAVAFGSFGLGVPACGGGDGGGAQGAGGSGGSAGTSDGGGSAGSSPGGKNSGGSSSGSQNGGKGSGGSGGSSGTGTGCHDNTECPTMTMPPFTFGITQCLSPGQPPPSPGCGAPFWCGQCICPPMPTEPAGSRNPCQSSADCPTQEGAASICNQGSCTRCVQQTDCPEAAPACSTLTAQFASGFSLCTQCTTDEHCPVNARFCAAAYGIGKCVSCRATADCAQGVCNDGNCVPGCDQGSPCANPFTECTANQRCEPKGCATAADCGTNGACSDGKCGYRACQSDAECSGYCVNRTCYESLGTCHTQMAVP